jgi:Fe-coproporphyrin III synthase
VDGPAKEASSSVSPPIIQIHPTRRCNLSCLHCYSTSSPRERDQLGAETIIESLNSAYRQGYRTASFSGGEPMLCADLGALLRHAKSLGMGTTVTSNGMLLTAERLKMLQGCTDVLAISLDGLPETHDRMRDCPGAFQRMAANLEAVRASGVDFGFIFTLTLHNVNEAAWAADFALGQGAKLFQIRPLEEVGRAAEALAGCRPDELESAYAYLEAERIRGRFGNRLFVQLDLFHRDLVERVPERFYAETEWPAATNLAQCVSPIVIEADGTVSPIGYGFGRRFTIGRLPDRSLDDLAREWMSNVYPAFRELCRGVYRQACRPSPLPFINWYEMLHFASLETRENQS